MLVYIVILVAMLIGFGIGIATGVYLKDDMFDENEDNGFEEEYFIIKD